MTRYRDRILTFMLGTLATFGIGLEMQTGFAQQQQPADAPKPDSKPAAKPLPHSKTVRNPAVNSRGKQASKPQGGLRIGGAPAGQIRNEVDKKNNIDRPKLNAARDTQYFRVAVARPDGSFLSLNYYPALPGENPPVVLLVHEKERSSRDFADKIEELKDPNGLAAELQNEGFAVVSLDVAGLSDPRKRNANLAKNEPAKKAQPAENLASVNSVEQAVRDLRLSYQFLVDRHNRLEFNLGKLTLLTLGEGSNASLEWLREATQPVPNRPNFRQIPNDPRFKNAGAIAAAGGMNSATDRPSDVSAMILISPVESWLNVRTAQTLKNLLPGSPVNVLVIGGSKDKATADTLIALKPIVERLESRLSKVETLETSLHGARLLRFEPGLVPKLNRFLEQTVEFQKTEWEPRYNLTPVAYRLQEAVSKSAAQTESRTAAAGLEKEKAAEKTKEPAKPADTAKPAEKATTKPATQPAKPADAAKPAEKATTKPATQPAKPADAAKPAEKATTKPATQPAKSADAAKPAAVAVDPPKN